MEFNGRIYDLLGYQKDDVRRLFLFMDTLHVQEWDSNESISTLMINRGEDRLHSSLSEKTEELLHLPPRLLVSWFVDGRLSLAREEIKSLNSTSYKGIKLFNAGTMEFVGHRQTSGNPLDENLLKIRQNSFIISSSIFGLFELYIQFEKGKIKSGADSTVGKVYINYITRKYSVSKELALDFYKEVRCSIVHSFCLGYAALGECGGNFYCGSSGEVHVFDLKVFYKLLLDDIEHLILKIERDTIQAKKSFKKLKSMY